MNQALDPLLAAVMVVAAALPLMFWIRSLLRIYIGTAGLLALTVNIVVIVAALWLANQPDSQWNEPQSQSFALLKHELRGPNAPPIALALMVAANLVIALSAKLYRASVLGKATPEEQSPGIAGIRAWISPVNVLAVITIAICAYFSVGYDYVGVTIIGLCALLAYPGMNIIMTNQAPIVTPISESDSSPKAPGDERQRVLALVESGKITAEDGAELLTALAQSQVASAVSSAPLSVPRRIMLVGAVTAMVGFFLPWFTINVPQIGRDLMNGVQHNMPQFQGSAVPNVPNITFNGQTGFAANGNQASGTSVPANMMMQWDIRGGDVQHGLGWIILAAAMASAGLPFFWTPGVIKRTNLRNAILATLTVGSIGLLYVLSDSFNSVTSIDPGFILAIAGYAVLWVGSVREYLLPRSGFQPALVPA